MNKTSTISAVITVRNGEKNLAACLESVKWADEIVVVDDESTDNTQQIARKFTKKVYMHKSVGYVEPVRNFAISKARGEWILVLDADERIPESLSVKLRKISGIEATIEGVEIPRQNIIFGQWIQHSGWWPDYQLRFFRKGNLSWPTQIHAQPKLSWVPLKLDPKEEYGITHFNYETISEFLEKMNRYTDVQAREFINSKQKFNWTDLLNKPFSEFLSRFFARSGYKDGLHGLILAILQGISMFVVVLKIWEKNGFEEIDSKILLQYTERELDKTRKELLYWFTHEKINEIKNPVKKNAYKLFRKFAK